MNTETGEITSPPRASGRTPAPTKLNLPQPAMPNLAGSRRYGQVGDSPRFRRGRGSSAPLRTGTTWFLADLFQRYGATPTSATPNSTVERTANE
ncbi:hypothetical protein ACPA9J_00090 [Pseudomonas aeruginosa]